MHGKLLIGASLLVLAHISTVATQCITTGPSCLTASPTACTSLPNGDYQACEGCTIYHSCSNGLISARRNCPKTTQDGLEGYLVWVAQRSNQGYCDYFSTTCKACATGPICTSGSQSGTSCITRAVTACVGLADGDYQACEGCNIYHSCSNGLISAERPCARRPDGTQLVWVTERTARGHCDYVSNTCHACRK